ncbi:hypothetical protein AB0M58_13635 [Streptomyces bobili]|uniref:hypothetical protein n=1 Tax=Streptomyces bobili TaxID=67280 RepID=UPI003424ED91
MDFSAPPTGTLTVSPPLNPQEIAFLRSFSASRRMRRREGPYSTREDVPYDDLGPVDYNRPHEGQPGLSCNWEPTDDGAGIRWDGSTSFDHADEWLQYIVDHFLRPGAVAQHLADSSQRPDQVDFSAFTFDHHVNGELHGQVEYCCDWQAHCILTVEEDTVRIRYERPRQ